MDHPIIRNIQNLLYYTALWILISGIHFVILVVFSKIGIIPAVSDSLYFNLSFGLLAIPVWYVVRFSKTGRSNTINLLINHLTTVCVIMLLWVGIGITLLRSLFNMDESYTAFLYTSIPWRIISGTFFYSIIVLIYYIIIYYNNLQEKLMNEKKMMEMVKQSELDMLKSQINPHFLFNSLNSISSLTITNPGKAQEMIIKLSDFLRYSVSQQSNMLTSLRMELDHIRCYLDIEQVRFGSRLQYENIIPENCLDAKIPVMILQPLYENAIKHGVYESAGTITIRTVCKIKESVLEIVILNNFESSVKSAKGAGIGLKNIRDRLKLIYRNDQLLKTAVKEQFFEVKLFIPQEI